MTAVLDAVAGDPSELPWRICVALTDVLGVDGAAISALTDTGLRQQLGASDDIADAVEDVQFTVGEGPCVQAAATGHPVIVEDLWNDPGIRWPGFADLAARRLPDVRALYGFPLRVDATTLGAVNLYARTPRGLSATDVRHTSDAVDLAASVLLSTPRCIPEEPLEALTGADPWRSMHLAIGVVAGATGVSPSDALVRMRAHAFSRDILLSELAGEVLTDRIAPGDLAQ